MRNNVISNQATKIIAISMAMGLFTGCASNQTTHQVSDTKEAKQAKPKAHESHGHHEHRGKRPSAEQLFARMDSNKDNKLAKSEVKGPLARYFSEVDSNGDGFITKTELENAPKPPHRGGQRPQR